MIDMLNERIDLDTTVISKRVADGATEARLSIWSRDGDRDPIGRFSLIGLTPTQIGEQIVDRAQRVVALMNGTQRIYVAFTDESGDPYGVLPFTLAGGSVDESPREVSPDERGGYAQTLSHNQFLIESTKQAMGVLAGFAAKDSKSLRDENAELRRERAEWLKERERSMTEQHARELMAEESKARRENWSKVAGVIVSLIPTVVNRVSGADLVPMVTTPAEVVLTELVAKMDEPIFAELFSRLSLRDRMMWESARELVERRVRVMSTEEKVDLGRRIEDLLYGFQKTDWFAKLKESKGTTNDANGTNGSHS